MKKRFVPELVFATTVAGVVPACGGDARQHLVIALAVAGFSGCIERDGGGDGAAAGGASGNGRECGTGGIHIVSTGGAAGRANTGGATGSGGVIVLAIAGFSRGGSR